MDALDEEDFFARENMRCRTFPTKILVTGVALFAGSLVMPTMDLQRWFCGAISFGFGLGMTVGLIPCLIRDGVSETVHDLPMGLLIAGGILGTFANASAAISLLCRFPNCRCGKAGVIAVRAVWILVGVLLLLPPANACTCLFLESDSGALFFEPLYFTWLAGLTLISVGNEMSLREILMDDLKTRWDSAS